MGNDDKKALEIKWRNKEIWEWLSRNIDKIMDYGPIPTFQMRTGGVLGKRGYKGKPHPDMDLHPEFLRYLETPEFIKLAHEMFKELYQKDRNLYNFTYLRAKGLTYGQIMATGAVSTNLLKGGKEKMLVGNLERSRGASGMNRRALNFILSWLPENLKKSWGDVPNHDWEAPYKKEQAQKENEQWRKEGERVTCPMCGGVDSECVLCSYPYRAWDGTISWRMARRYKEIVESGGVWEKMTPREEGRELTIKQGEA